MRTTLILQIDHEPKDRQLIRDWMRRTRSNIRIPDFRECQVAWQLISRTTEDDKTSFIPHDLSTVSE